MLAGRRSLVRTGGRWRTRGHVVSWAPARTARAVYGYDLLLLRPDLHVAWRSNRPPDDPERLAAIVTGNARKQ
jgi:hypothetical protein